MNTQPFKDNIKSTCEEIHPAALSSFQYRVREERVRQYNKFGNQHMTPSQWLVVLGEEYGELCKAVCDGDYQNSLDELIQVAAVCANIYEQNYTERIIPEFVENKDD
jgi:NTP pyrophosphatase (non-canonical NTP hydrolase)